MNETTKNPRITVSFTTTEEMKDWIIAAAEQDDRSVSRFLNRLVRDWREHSGDRNPQS